MSAAPSLARSSQGILPDKLKICTLLGAYTSLPRAHRLSDLHTRGLSARLPWIEVHLVVNTLRVVLWRWWHREVASQSIV